MSPKGSDAQLVGLNELEIKKRAQELARRISERFPNRGLTQAAVNLAQKAQFFADEARSLRGQNIGLKVRLAISFLLGAFAITWIFVQLHEYKLLRLVVQERNDFLQVLQGIDALTNILAITGLTWFFIIRWDMRKKQRLALRRLHQLRSYAHVVDMHQLGKDVVAFISGLERTEFSRTRDLEPPYLLHYLDYCTQVLALVSKFASLNAQYSRDSAVIAAVNDIELLTSSLSREIWQKIAILQSIVYQEQNAPLKLEKISASA